MNPLVVELYTQMFEEISEELKLPKYNDQFINCGPAPPQIVSAEKLCDRITMWQSDPDSGRLSCIQTDFGNDNAKGFMTRDFKEEFRAVIVEDAWEKAKNKNGGFDTISIKELINKGAITSASKFLDIYFKYLERRFRIFRCADFSKSLNTLNIEQLLGLYEKLITSNINKEDIVAPYLIK